jgi:hypothetical protein
MAKGIHQQIKPVYVQNISANFDTHFANFAHVFTTYPSIPDGTFFLQLSLFVYQH